MRARIWFSVCGNSPSMRVVFDLIPEIIEIFLPRLFHN
jgi:hypothetical protein